MNEQTPRQPTADASRATLSFVLLLMQAAIGLLETLVTLAFAGATPIGAAVGLASAAIVTLLVVIAAGVVRGWRWARIAATVFEGLLLLGAALRLLLRHGTSNGLVWLLADVALPIALIDLLWIRYAPEPKLQVGSAVESTDTAARRRNGAAQPAPPA
ncbi:MAG TPA: hypothetical protein VKV26_19620 [Dehalococcoidia bacterium]|nr:hypothetical protein [Dehalococcoidia bacterium]